jgi:hypothetical protein
MKQRRRIYYSAAQRSEIWDRWQAGEAMSSIGRRFDLGPATSGLPRILLKKSISEGSRLLREGLVRSLGNYVADLVIGSFFNERPF